MNRLARFAILLYPARWRTRYGNEVEALLDDVGADARVVADLLKTAVRMQFSTWSFPRLAAVLGLVGMLAGLAFSFLTPVQYVARAELQLTGADSGIVAVGMAGSMVNSRASLANVINNPAIDLYRDERKTSPLQDVIDQMRHDIVFRPAGPNAFTIQFTYREQAGAKAAVEALARNAAEQFRDLTKLARKYYGANSIEVIEPASLPVAPLRPDLLPMTFGGLAVGLLLAGLWHIKSKRPRYIACLVAGAAAGVAMAYLLPSIAGIFPDDFTLLRYESHATMYAERWDPAPDLVMEASSRSAMAALNSDSHLRLYASQLKNDTVENVADRLRRNLAINTRGDGGNGRFVDFSFTCFDRFKSQQTVNAIMNRITEDNRATTRPANSSPARQTQWGQMIPAGETGITVDTVTPNRAAAMFPGLLAGLDSPRSSRWYAGGGGLRRKMK
jgi:hypothetical protein